MKSNRRPDCVGGPDPIPLQVDGNQKPIKSVPRIRVKRGQRNEVYLRIVRRSGVMDCCAASITSRRRRQGRSFSATHACLCQRLEAIFVAGFDGRRTLSDTGRVIRPTVLKKMHYSSIYNNAPMPYSVFFLGGYAVHGTNHVKRTRAACVAWLRAFASIPCSKALHAGEALWTRQITDRD